MTNSALPRRKVAVGAVSGALVTVFVYLVQQIIGKELPATEVAALTTLCTFAVSYLTPSEDQDQTTIDMTERQAAVLKHLLDEAPDPPGWEPEPQIPPRPTLRRPIVPHG